MDEREYLCEVCGRRETLTEEAAYNSGWDYPPFIGKWGIVSPRTCGNCAMTDTAWWYLITQGPSDLPPHHMETVKRIVAEGANVDSQT